MLITHINSRKVIGFGFLSALSIALISARLESSALAHSGSANNTAKPSQSNYLMADRDDDRDDHINEAPGSQKKPAVSAEQARAAALAVNPGTTARKVELDHERGKLVYEVKLNNGRKVYVDANSGKVVGTKTEDD